MTFVKHDEHSPKTNRQHKIHEKCCTTTASVSLLTTGDEARLNATAQAPPAPAPEPHDADQHEPQPRARSAAPTMCSAQAGLATSAACLSLTTRSISVALEAFCFRAFPFDSGKLQMFFLLRCLQVSAGCLFCRVILVFVR